MTGSEVRASYLRLADPVGTPARWIHTVIALGGLAAYGLVSTRGWVPAIVPWLAAAGAAYYGFQSLRVRLLARDGAEEAVRALYAEKARRVLDLAPSLPVRAVLWLALSAWAWTSIARGREYPFGTDRDLAAFLGGIGGLLAARHLLEWRVEVPGLRRDFAALSQA